MLIKDEEIPQSFIPIKGDGLSSTLKQAVENSSQEKSPRETPMDPDQIYERMGIEVKLSCNLITLIISLEFVRVHSFSHEKELQAEISHAILELAHPKIQEAYGNNKYQVLFFYNHIKVFQISIPCNIAILIIQYSITRCPLQ